LSTRFGGDQGTRAVAEEVVALIDSIVT